VAEQYREHGFVNATALRGGADAWQKAGYRKAA
jgi:rhodanese-related sulfurtransferase